MQHIHERGGGSIVFFREPNEEGQWEGIVGGGRQSSSQLEGSGTVGWAILVVSGKRRM